jgi:hypothetical protein
MPMNDLGRAHISKPAAMGMPSDLPQATQRFWFAG